MISVSGKMTSFPAGPSLHRRRQSIRGTNTKSVVDRRRPFINSQGSMFVLEDVPRTSVLFTFDAAGKVPCFDFVQILAGSDPGRKDGAFTPRTTWNFDLRSEVVSDRLTTVDHLIDEGSDDPRLFSATEFRSSNGTRRCFGRRRNFRANKLRWEQACVN